MKTLLQIIAPTLLLLGAACQGGISRGDDVVLFLEPLQASDLATAAGGVGLVGGASLIDAVNFEKNRVGLSWKVDGSAIHETPVPHRASSRQYWSYVSANDLSRGTTIAISSPGAIVKLSPATPSGAASKALPLEELLITDAAGTRYAGVDAVELGATYDEFQAGELTFGPGTTLFKLRPELGAGPLQLSLREAASAPSYDVLVHVFEPQSEVALELQAGSDSYLKGQTLEFTTQWKGDVAPKPETLRAEVVSPDGTRTPVQLVAGAAGSFVGSLPLIQEATKPGELWELRVDAQAEGPAGITRRTVRSSFAYALGTAGLDPIVSLAGWPAQDDLTLRFGVQVGSAGRYALTGVLYGTNAAGELVPFLMSQAAATSEAAGKSGIELLFEDYKTAGAGLSAPYEVRDLRLLDQTRMGLLHRQARAIVLPSAP
jgi:Domain of unknown function (DUF4785)